MKAILPFILACLLFTGCGSDSSQNPDETRSTESESAFPSLPPLIVGMNLSYPPFETKDADGNPAGVSVDLAHAMGEHLGREIKIQDTAWEGIIPALRSGRIDCIISSMTRTEDREKTIAFSDPYVRTGICLLVQKDGTIQNADQLNQEGRKVAVQLATTGQTWAEANLPNAEILVFRDANSCAQEVALKRADAFIFDQISVYQFSLTHSETTRALLEPIREEVWAVGLRQDSEELKTQINQFIAHFRETGGFDELAEIHFSQWKEDFAKLGVSFVF